MKRNKAITKVITETLMQNCIWAENKDGQICTKESVRRDVDVLVEKDELLDVEIVLLILRDFGVTINSSIEVA